MLFTSIRSSSSGNAAILSTGTENILIDCGVSAKTINASLKELGLSLEKITAVLLTHEHSDHTKALKRLMSAYDIPLYTSFGTWNRLSEVTKDAYFSFEGFEKFHPIQADREFYIGNTLVTPFRTYHDTPGPLGFRFDMESTVFGHDAACALLTDCGHFDGYLQDHLKGLDAIILESNHDEQMLLRGSYPVSLKRRILSDMGHASNASSAAFIRSIYSERLRNVLLAHLSDENNDPEFALDYVTKNVGIPALTIKVAPKDRMADSIIL